MGFDLMGLKPIANTPLPDIMASLQGKDGYVVWENKTEEDKSKYFKAKEKYDKDNPGSYFRNNVWWWRPLWNFICITCDDILSQKQMDSGGYNDGVKIYKTKAKKLAIRIKKLDADGTIQKYEDEYMSEIKIAIAHNKKVDKVMKKFEKTMEIKYGEKLPSSKYTDKEDRDTWSDLYDTRMFQASYPFSRKNVMDFGIFCEQSGGFEIW